MAIPGRRLALALLVLLVALMLAPRIPDRFGGNLWLGVAGYGAVALLLRETWREARTIRAWWTGMRRGRRSALGTVVVVATLLGALAMRTWAPGPFGKFSRENGLWEPLSLLLYWGSAVVIHRAILGSFERLIGVLIEHHEGKFPLWLAPVQARVMNITDAQAAAATEAHRTLRAAGLRVDLDLGGEKVGAKIRAATLERIPYMLVVGAREAESGQVAVRERSGKDLGPMTVEAFRLLADDLIRRRA